MKTNPSHKSLADTPKTPEIPLISGVHLAPIPGLPNYYADQKGNIWSTNNRNDTLKKPRRLTPFLNYHGRPVVKVVFPDGRRANMTLGCLIARALLKAPTGVKIRTYQINRKAGFKPENLRWKVVK